MTDVAEMQHDEDAVTEPCDGSIALYCYDQLRKDKVSDTVY